MMCGFLLQACIDDRIDMVKFLVQRGADINRGDNEGWTPLHATASCGYLDIAKYAERFRWSIESIFKIKIELLISC